MDFKEVKSKSEEAFELSALLTTSKRCLDSEGFVDEDCTVPSEPCVAHVQRAGTGPPILTFLLHRASLRLQSQYVFPWSSLLFGLISPL